MFLTGKPAFFKTFIHWLDFQHDKANSSLREGVDVSKNAERITDIVVVRQFVAEYLKVGK